MKLLPKIFPLILLLLILSCENDNIFGPDILQENDESLNDNLFYGEWKLSEIKMFGKLISYHCKDDIVTKYYNQTYLPNHPDSTRKDWDDPVEIFVEININGTINFKFISPKPTSYFSCHWIKNGNELIIYNEGLEEENFSLIIEDNSELIYISNNVNSIKYIDTMKIYFYKDISLIN